LELIAPDILIDVKELSPSLNVAALLVGAVLWCAGWWSHRFWTVLAFTVLGGIVGLQNAEALKSQPLVAAIGVGLAAGVLALTVVRLGAFAAGGYAGMVVMHAVFPTFEQPLLGFLMGAFLGFILFRYWTMALTSLVGVVLMGYAALALFDRLGKFDAVVWSQNNVNMLNVVCGLMAAAGVAIQLVVAWLRRPSSSDNKDKGDKGAKKPKADGVLAASLAAFRRAG
jgi:hypothetical protein